MSMLSGLINTGEKTTVVVGQIKSDGGTQMRAGLDEATVQEYAEKMENGWGDFPPVVLYHDGTDYWLADGFHRLAAYKSLVAVGDTTIPADVRSGTRRDAILYAAAANANHGLRRTNADKRRAVEVLLRDEEWAKWSDREIGRRCDVTHVFVAKIRNELSGNNYQMLTERTVQRGGVTFTQNTANIGTNQSARKKPIRHDAVLPALNMPAPAGTFQTPFGAIPKNPIENWELEDIVGQVATEYYGKMTTRAGDAMTQQCEAQAGEYWEKLRRVLAPFDVTPERIGAAVATTVERLVGERRGLRPGSPEAKQLGKEIKAGTWGDPAPAAKIQGGGVPDPVDRAEDSWLATFADGGTTAEIAQRLAVLIEPWVSTWTDENGRTWRDVAGRNPQHANSPFRQDFNRELERRRIERRFSIDVAFSDAIRMAFRSLAMAESGMTPDDESLTVNGMRAMQAAQAAQSEAEPGEDDLQMQAAPASPDVLTASTMADLLRPQVTEFYDNGSDTWQRHAARDIRLNSRDKDGAFWRLCMGEMHRSKYRQNAQWTTGLLRQALDLMADELQTAIPITPAVEPPIEIPLKPAPDDRIGRAIRLIGIYNLAISTEDEYGDLTSCFSEWLTPKRELQRLVARLQRLVDLLEGRTVEPMEDCD